MGPQKERRLGYVVEVIFVSWLRKDGFITIIGPTIHFGLQLKEKEYLTILKTFNMLGFQIFMLVVAGIYIILQLPFLITTDTAEDR
jgi:MFS-type transporter involved in bile tolerance (Atg22 family)